MRFGHILLFLASFALAFGAVPAKKAIVRKGAVKTASKTTGKAPIRATGKAGSRTVAGKQGAKAVPTVYRQQQPSPDRYREIQQALVEKGYLKSEPNGVWGADSVDALKQFQTEKSLPVTGKLSSRSLIGLGLGTKPEGPFVMPSATPEAAPAVQR